MAGKKKRRPLRRIIKFARVRIAASSEREARARFADLVEGMIEEDFESFEFLDWGTFARTKVGLTGRWWSPDYDRDEIVGTLQWSNRREGKRWIFTEGRKGSFDYSEAPPKQVRGRRETWDDGISRMVRRDRRGRFA